MGYISKKEKYRADRRPAEKKKEHRHAPIFVQLRIKNFF
jgi:hypothetical protein